MSTRPIQSPRPGGSSDAATLRARRATTRLAVTLALTMLTSLLGATFPQEARADVSVVYCDDGTSAGTTGPGTNSNCAARISYYEAQGCTVSFSEENSGGSANDAEDKLTVTCPGPVPLGPGDPGGPEDPTDDLPFVCDRAGLDPDWVNVGGAGDATGEDWRFIRASGPTDATLTGGTFVTDYGWGYGGFLQTNPSTGGERMVITSGTGIDVDAGTCIHWEYTPGTTDDVIVSGTETRYDDYVAGATNDINGSRIFTCPVSGDLVTGQEVADGASCVYDAQDVRVGTRLTTDSAVAGTNDGNWEEYRRNFVWNIRALDDIPVLDADNRVFATIPTGRPVASVAVGLSWLRGTGAIPGTSGIICDVQVISVQPFVPEPLEGLEQLTEWNPPDSPRVVNGNPAGTGVYPSGRTSTCGPEGNAKGGTSWTGQVRGNLKLKFNVMGQAGPLTGGVGADLTARQFTGTVTINSDNSATYIPDDTYDEVLQQVGP